MVDGRPSGHGEHAGRREGGGAEIDIRSTPSPRRASALGVGAVLLLVAACGSPTPDAPASSSPSAPPAVITSSTAPAVPPFIDRVVWVTTPSGRSLQVYPTSSGRRAQGDGDAAEAWREVLADDPTAGTPGMQAQFDCHWTFARLVEPDKPSWNLEPWRPVVDSQQMIAARCNPGGPEI